jgi:MFS family permease
VYGTCFFQIFASVPQFFSHVFQYSEDLVGLLMALNGAIVVVVEMPLILVLEKKKREFSFIILGTLLLPIAFLILLLGKSAILYSIAYTVVITLSEIFAMPFMMNYALSRAPKDRQGQYSALYSIGFGLATITAPVIGLGIADRFGFNALFYTLISISLLLAIFFYVIRNDKPIGA